MIRIIPSLASADPLDLKAAIDSLGGADAIHLDIEDGNFIPNITFGLKTVRAVAGYMNGALDAHLLVTDPAAYIDGLVQAGVRSIAFHVEPVRYPAELLHRIRDLGCRAGLAFNLETDVGTARIYADMVDYVLLMTAGPDMEGQQFRDHALEKIAQTRRSLPPHVSIMVDGGITEALLPRVAAAGADTVIMGRTIWGDKAPGRRWRQLTDMVNGIKS